MELTVERATQIGENLKQVVEAINSFSEDELVALIDVANHLQTMGPFIDPTRFRDEAQGIHQGKTFLKSLLQFKREVKGIGNCR